MKKRLSKSLSNEIILLYAQYIIHYQIFRYRVKIADIFPYVHTKSAQVKCESAQYFMLLSYGNIQNKVLLSPPVSLDKDLFLLDEQEYPSQYAPLSPKLH